MKRQFSKDGRVTTATSAAEAVQLAYDGWHEAPAVAEPTPDAEPSPEPDSSTTPKKRTSNR